VAVVPEPFGAVEDLQPGVTMVACEKPALPVASAKPVRTASDGFGGLTE